MKLRSATFPSISARRTCASTPSAPGPLKTLASSGISDFKQIFNHIEEHAPLRRNVTTEDVGKAAVFLASDLGSAVTGEIMFVDCGYNNLGI